MAVSAPVRSKRCSACTETKPIDQFYRRKGVPDGRHYRCKLCMNGATRRSSAKRDPNELRAMNRVRGQRWREAHPQEFKRSQRAKRARARARDIDLDRARRREQEARRRARQRAAFVEPVDAQAVWERDEGVCGICGQAADPADWHLDHVIPLARGGAHSMANVQVSHPLCNRKKGAS